ncbi:hypothetical protein N7451_000732 [Penicillium sp. IBT 35674x]|nr:hypothetical protein N7451_000732 [Penicillium sp. IBT 35674x]
MAHRGTPIILDDMENADGERNCQEDVWKTVESEENERIDNFMRMVEGLAALKNVRHILPDRLAVSAIELIRG